MFEQYLLDVFVYGALGYLSFRYAEMILTGQFSRRGLVLFRHFSIYPLIRRSPASSASLRPRPAAWRGCLPAPR